MPWRPLLRTDSPKRRFSAATSKSDRARRLRNKMQEYVENGARLGWLIDPLEHRVFVYRPSKQVDVLEQPDFLSGDPELPGFVLDLAEIWNPRI